jgi:hypothetical protein
MASCDLIHIKTFRFATCGVAAQILLAIKYNGQIYRGIAPFYNAQPEDHQISELEDTIKINRIVRSTLNKWDGMALIYPNEITVPLFYDVPDYDRNPKYTSTQGCSFGTIVHLKPNAKISTNFPWEFDEST